MTPNQPHPLRCETCKNTKGKDPIICKVINEAVYGEFLSSYIQEVVSRVGCASHSSITNTRQQFTDRELGVISLALPKLDILMPDFCEGHTDEETIDILEKISRMRGEGGGK